MTVSSQIVSKNQQCSIVENENKNLCKIFNLNEIEILFERYSKYRVFLYTINTLNYIELQSSEFLKNLEKHCTENLNYSLINYVNHEEQVIKIFITPIVTSA
jgi:hypothetical protein